VIPRSLFEEAKGEGTVEDTQDQVVFRATNIGALVPPDKLAEYARQLMNTLAGLPWTEEPAAAEEQEPAAEGQETTADETGTPGE
jgi:hypothetical protein